MRYIFASFSAVAFAAGPTSTLLWVQSACVERHLPHDGTPPLTFTSSSLDENAAVYTSAGLARHVGSTPTFATATWLNKPFYVRHAPAGAYHCVACPGNNAPKRSTTTISP